MSDENLVKEIRNLSEKVEDLEQSVRKVLDFLTPAGGKVIFLDDVLNNPKEYNFNLMDGLTIGGFVKQREAEVACDPVKKNKLDIELLFSGGSLDDLLADLPPMLKQRTFSRLIDILDVPKSDLMVCKANTYLKIKDYPKKEFIPPKDALKPFVYMETIDLVENISKGDWSVLAFVGNLFLKNISGDWFSSKSADYEEKSLEERNRIMRLKEQDNVLLLEHQMVEGDIRGGRLKFAVNPIVEIIHVEMSAGGEESMFIRFAIDGGTPKFYNIVREGLNIDDPWVSLQDIETGVIRTFPQEEFEEQWKKTDYEMVLLSPKTRYGHEIWNYLIKQIVDLAEETNQIFDPNILAIMRDSCDDFKKELIYRLFKNKGHLGDVDVLFFSNDSGN